MARSKSMEDCIKNQESSGLCLRVRLSFGPEPHEASWIWFLATSHCTTISTVKDRWDSAPVFIRTLHPVLRWNKELIVLPHYCVEPIWRNMKKQPIHCCYNVRYRGHFKVKLCHEAVPWYNSHGTQLARAHLFQGSFQKGKSLIAPKK